MKRLIILSFLFTAVLVQGQAPQRFYGKFGGAGIDIGYGVKQTLDRNYIVVGSTSSYGAGNTDVYLVKVDSMGWTTWQKTFGGFGNDVGRSVIQLPDSGYVIAGFTNSYGAGGYDALIIRTDKNGNFIWQKTFGGTDWDFAYDLVYTSDAHIVICGSTTSFGHGNKDGFMAKYDIAGTLIWQKFFGGVEDDEFKAITTKNGSDLFAAGSAQSYGNLDGDMFCFKVDNNGDSLMRIVYGGPLWDAANSLVINANNEIILAGGTSNNTAGGTDALFVKFDSNGTFIVRKTQGYADDEEAFKIILSPTANLAETMAIYTTHELAGYKADAKTIYMDASLDWFGGQDSGKFGFTQDDEVFDIAATKDKGCVEIGYTTSLGALDKDVFLIKADSTLEEDYSIVGIKKTNINSREISIYPNPVKANQDITVNGLSLANQNYDLNICSITGQVIYEVKNQNGTEVIIPFKDLPAGIYFLRMHSKEAVYNYKIIKE